jgi:hypothetical protein
MITDQYRAGNKRELLLALAERVDQILWCLLTATDARCNEKARTEATLEAQKFAQGAEALLHGSDDLTQAGDPDLHELILAVNLAVNDLEAGLLQNRTEFIAAVRAKVPDATDSEILAAVRQQGALQVREIEQITRHMVAQGAVSDMAGGQGGVSDKAIADSWRMFVEPYVAAAAVLDEWPAKR